MSSFSWAVKAFLFLQVSSVIHSECADGIVGAIDHWLSICGMFCAWVHCVHLPILFSQQTEEGCSYGSQCSWQSCAQTHTCRQSFFFFFCFCYWFLLCFVFVCFFCFCLFVCFKTGFLYVSLAVLKLTHSVGQAALEHKYPPAPASLGLKAWATTPGHFPPFEHPTTTAANMLEFKMTSFLQRTKISLV